MTDASSPRSDDPRRVVDQLRADVDTVDTESEPIDESGAIELWGARAVADPQIRYSAVVLAAADELVPPAEVSTEARQRFIAAAERALSRRRADRGLLPVALHAARERAGLTVDEVQQRLGGETVASVADLEAGRLPIRSVGPTVTAAWIHAVRADRRLAVDAARRSLDAVASSELRPAAGADAVGGSSDDWIRELVTHLDETESPKVGDD
jgi:hypothetical protein